MAVLVVLSGIIPVYVFSPLLYISILASIPSTCRKSSRKQCASLPRQQPRTGCVPCAAGLHQTSPTTGLTGTQRILWALCDMWQWRGRMPIPQNASSFMMDDGDIKPKCLLRKMHASVRWWADLKCIPSMISGNLEIMIAMTESLWFSNQELIVF